MTLDTKQLQQISILYVEDDSIVRAQTEKILTKLFKKVFVASDGQEGLDTYKKSIEDIDIVITDINMPKLSGLDMIDQINEMTKSIPTIVTSAHSDSSNLLKAIDANVDKYIAKPIQIKELTVTVVELVVKYKRVHNIENLAKTLVQKTTQSDKAQTELNSELEMLKNQNTYLNSIVDNMVLNCKVDKNGNIIEVSNKFQTFFDHSEIMGQNISALRCETCVQETFQKLMLRAIHSKKTVMSNYTLITSSGRKINTDVTLTPFYGEGALVHGYIIYIDIL